MSEFCKFTRAVIPAGTGGEFIYVRPSEIVLVIPCIDEQSCIISISNGDNFNVKGTVEGILRSICEFVGEFDGVSVH